MMKEKSNIDVNTDSKIKIPKHTYVQSRNWCFTDFQLLDFSKIWNEYQDLIRYMIIGNELCPKTGKIHKQGYIQFFNKKRMNGVKKILKSKCIHLETTRGTPKANKIYCAKDKNFKEYGKVMNQGHRSDLETIKKQLDDGADMYHIAQTNFGSFVRYWPGLYKYKQMCDKRRTRKWRKLEVVLIMGPTDSGKTRKAMEDATYKISASELQWFDGYDMDETICIDEYNNDVPITRMLGLLDGYQYRLPIKGGFTYANWNKVYITTNLRKAQLHTLAKPAHRDALFRRITEIRNLWPRCQSD